LNVSALKLGSTALQFSKKDYLSHVKLHWHLLFRKITALMLMALMLYINAIKLFHTHPGGYSFNVVCAHVSPSVSPEKPGQHIVRGNHCAICDFQLTRDANVAAACIDIIPIRQVDVYRATALQAHLPVFDITSSGRAPPATV
jgi:hypothetical protein